MKARIFNEEEQKIILNAYINEGRSLKYCGELVKADQGVIRKFLVNQNIEIRKYATNKKKVDKEKVKDKTYFSKERENSNMAWLLGFLASDGTISKDKNSIKIGLSSKDKEILEKIKEELKLEESHVTGYTTNTGFDVNELFWTCAQHKEDLARYGIVPQKTFKLKPPYELDRKYWIDYLRGYFDGDGSISMRNSGDITFSICSATKEILEFFIKFLYEDYGIEPVNLMEDKRGKNINYSFRYSTNASLKIYEYLYTSGSLYLARKKEKYDQIIQKKYQQRMK